mmetsp:Transcript_30526/g.79245  ORF Transcript_30526/g.79245 Transcript_30526/m.79245 type:complete len:93 (+) Transcript_30526:1704-1982(+)
MCSASSSAPTCMAATCCLAAATQTGASLIVPDPAASLFPARGTVAPIVMSHWLIECLRPVLLGHMAHLLVPQRPCVPSRMVVPGVTHLPESC